MKRWADGIAVKNQGSAALQRAEVLTFRFLIRYKSSPDSQPFPSFFLLSLFRFLVFFSFFFFEKILPSRSRFSCGSLGVRCDDVARVNSAPSNIIGQPCVRRNFEECLCVRMTMVFANSQIFLNSLLKFRLLWVILQVVNGLGIIN